MREFAIITDSGCDLSKELVEELGVNVVPMGLTIGGRAYKHYHDFRELSKDEFYSLIENGEVGTTSCVNIQDVADKMEEKAKKGMDVLYLSFSSGMSGSYQSAVAAASDVKEKYPNAKIEVVDTLSGSVGLGMLVYLAAKQKALNKTFEDVVEFVEKHKRNICHYFIVSDLKYIQKTGRTSHLSAFIGTMLNIKPIFKLDNNGKVKDDIKIRGKKSWN